jgi:cell division septation protein DedD
VAEGETQYNIPVSSKQLIVYFVFLVIALSAAFLAGVMVGRNVDSSPQQTVRDIQDVVQEEPVASPTPDALTYGSTLAGDKIEGLSPAPGSTTTPVPQATPRAKSSPAAMTSPSPSPVATPRLAAIPSNLPPRPTATPASRAAAKPTATPRATPKPSPKQTASARPAATPLARLTIQVGAFKERAAAEAIVKRLKGKGYSAYLVPVSEGLFNVRVGSFTKREDAERILAKLETQEKFKPFIVKP